MDFFSLKNFERSHDLYDECDQIGLGDDADE